MAYDTLRQIVDNVVQEAGLVAGSAVQTYTEPQAVLSVNRMFDFLWMKQRWRHLWRWETKVLDGTTGKFTTDLAGVNDWLDIAEIRITNRRGSQVGLSPDNRHLEVANGSTPMYYTPLVWDDADAETKLIQIWPLTATGSVDLYTGHRPARFEADDDVVPFDRTVITTGALWYLLADDGLNPEAADKAQGLYDIAYQDYTARYGEQAIGTGSVYDGRTVLISGA